MLLYIVEYHSPSNDHQSIVRLGEILKWNHGGLVCSPYLKWLILLHKKYKPRLTAIVTKYTSWTLNWLPLTVLINLRLLLLTCTETQFEHVWRMTRAGRRSCLIRPPDKCLSSCVLLPFFISWMTTTLKRCFPRILKPTKRTERHGSRPITGFGAGEHSQYRFIRLEQGDCVWCGVERCYPIHIIIIVHCSTHRVSRTNNSDS